MAKSKYRLTGGKRNGFSSFPKTIVEAIMWDKKKKPLEEVLDGKIDQPLDPAYVGKVPQVAQDGTVDWVVPLAGSTADSAMSDSSTNAPQNKVVKQYVDTVDGKVTALGQEVSAYSNKFLTADDTWFASSIDTPSTFVIISPAFNPAISAGEFLNTLLIFTIVFSFSSNNVVISIPIPVYSPCNCSSKSFVSD